MSPGVDWPGVYKRLAAAAAVLDRAAAPSHEEKVKILRDRARRLAAREAGPPEPGRSELVVFLLGGEAYGVPSRFVSRVSALKELTAIPCTPAFILGVTSVQGRMVAVLDLRKLFELPEKGLAESDKLIILGAGETETVIRADAIIGVRSVDGEGAQAALPTMSDMQRKYLKGITPDRVTILDAEKLMTDPDLVVNDVVE